MSFRSRKNGENVLPFPGQKALAAAPAVRAPAAGPDRPAPGNSTPGRVGNALRALGHTLDIRRPRFGDPLPETLDLHAGAVIFGGPMSANDRRRIRPPGNRLDRNPAARAAAVPRHLPRRPDARQAIGRAGRAPSAKAAPRSAITRSARPTPVTRSARTGRITSITGTARDFELPAGAELLAEGDDFPVQAFQSGHAFGFQFHPDVTYAMMHRWTTRGCDGSIRRARGRASALRRSRGA